MVYVCVHVRVCTCMFVCTHVCVHADFNVSFQAAPTLVLHGLWLELCVKVAQTMLMLAQTISKTQTA